MSRLVTVIAAVIATVNSALGSSVTCTEKERQNHPALCFMLQRAEDDLDDFVRVAQAHASQHGLLVGENWVDNTIPDVLAETQRLRRLDGQLPVVFAHGMGDSCFNSGMQHITAHASNLLGGVYATCIPTGKTQAEDTKNGYFLNMDASVDVFAAAIAKDPKLQEGFHAIGFSQGNNVIRGYIANYNNPPIHTFISVNGVNAGDGAVPYCRPSMTEGKEESVEFDMCDFLMEQAGKQAYTEFAQEHSFQANYWRDPRPSAFKKYQKFCQLAKWNNEAGFVNQTLVSNWAKTQGFVWVMASKDGMVWPKEGEHWGAPDPDDPFHHILPMEETEWYKKDLFGLRTAQENNKNYFETFEGDHLQFSMEDFDRWITTYLKNN
uniref:Palmitoyl-protein thioesterase 1 n=1 Tax=Amphora coffeiformis TaxID=265554 RepID=A0A7S3L749_9STRA|eukprot:scaffold12163_cov176-Amphora_coffeaeformis.AAC.3